TSISAALPRRAACQTKSATSTTPGESSPDRPGIAEATVRAGVRGRIEEDRDAGREQRQAEQVEGLSDSRPRFGKEALREQNGHHPDREVDEEDPAPATLVDDRTSDHGSEDRAEEHRHADQAHHP